MPTSQWQPYDLGEVFGSSPIGQTINGLQTDTPAVPAHDPSYVPAAWMGDILTGLRLQYNLYVFGPTGSGKTAAIKFIASSLHIPVYEITGHSRLEFPELVGGYHVANGNMVWHDGPLASAMRNGGIFLLNEQSLLDPATAAGLNSILDGSPLLVPESNETIVPHPEFRYIATDNTNGSGDETGLYVGTLRQNSALMNRLMVIRADFLPEAVEANVVQNSAKSLPTDVVSNMVKFARAVRGADATDTEASLLSFTVSVRDLCRWAQLAEAYAHLSKHGVNVVQYAADRAMLWRASSADYSALTELMNRVFGYQSWYDDLATQTQSLVPLEVLDITE